MIVQLIVACYLIGSIPVAWLLTKLITGQDLRRLGSGNVGVMNTAVSVARWAGLLVFLTEAAKGALAVTLARAWGGDPSTGSGQAVVAVGAAVLATVIGTRWSIWLRGAGGRGNTAGAAALLLLSWQSLAIGLALWLIVRRLTRNGFLATRAAFVLFPFIFTLMTGSWAYLPFAMALSLVYLDAQRHESDDHARIRARWSGLWAFLTSPKRKGRI